jgi:hypothetical protein
VGQIRPLHGVNNGPICHGGIVDLTPYHQELGVPYTRLHDSHWVLPGVVDIPQIYPCFELDPDRPESYHFAKTDDYLAAIVRTGARIIYRLGTSIEHSTRKYYTHPPADYDKWASICVHIIRHYNEGWANGFHYDIPYWEIWNEPDIGPKMWTGTREEYFRLYLTAARAIKAHDAQLKVGGPALAGPTGDFRDPFLAFCRDNQAPLDFFSWHTYTSEPVILRRNAESVREALDTHGFGNVESHLNEWHYFDADWQRLRHDPLYLREADEHMNSPVGAAFAASALVLLQDSPVDVANYYSGDTLVGFGLFDRYGIPRKPYHALKAFRMLLDTPNRVACQGGDEETGLAVAAGLALDRRSATVLVSNHRAEEHAFGLHLEDAPWTDGAVADVFAVDGQADLDRIARSQVSGPDEPLYLECPPASIRVVRLTWDLRD